MDLELARRQCKELLAAEVAGDDASPYKSFMCPITREVMEYPVLARDGNSYERSAIEAHIAGQPTFRSPITNIVIDSEPLTPINYLRSDIQSKLEEMARAMVDGAAAGVAQRRRRD